MMSFYAKQNTSSGTACGAASAARMFAFLLLLVGVALSASIFVIAGRLPVIILLPVLLIGRLLIVLVSERDFRPGLD